MRTFIFIVFFLYSIIMNISCKNCEVSFYKKVLKQTSVITDSIDILVVIPGSGCTGCISGAENYLKTNVDKSSRIKYILTNIQSLKILKLKISKAIASPNIYIDEDNLWYDADNRLSIYPLVLYLNKKQIIKYNYISPESRYGLRELLM